MINALPKPKRGGGIRLRIALGHAHYIGHPTNTPVQARIHLKHHPEIMLIAAEQWDVRRGGYVQVDISSKTQHVPQIEGGFWSPSEKGPTA